MRVHQQDFSGIWVPLITPFAAGAVDHEGLRRLVHMLVGTGIAGFVVCGSTGEAAALSEAEQDAVLQTVLRGTGELPVILGVSGVTPAEVAARMARYDDGSLAGFLVPPPYYVRPSQRGVEDFYLTLADAVEATPLVLYDIPARTGVRIETATLLALAAHPMIQALKDCSGDADHLQTVIDDGRLQVLAGDDARIFTTLCQGGVGAIAASAHLRPELFAALHRHIHDSDLPAGRTLWRTLSPLVRALFAEPNPAPLKAALAQRMGLGSELRPPMAQASAACTAKLLELLA